MKVDETATMNVNVFPVGKEVDILIAMVPLELLVACSFGPTVHFHHCSTLVIEQSCLEVPLFQ